MSETRIRRHNVGVRLDDDEYATLKRLAKSGNFLGYEIPIATLVRELAMRQVKQISRKGKPSPTV